MFNIIGVAIAIAVAALLAWLAIGASRLKGRARRWGASGLAGLLAFAVLLLSVVAIVGLVKMYIRSAPLPELQVAGTPEQIERGREIADSFCAACHSKTAPLTGGSTGEAESKTTRVETQASVVVQNAHHSCRAFWAAKRRGAFYR